MAATLQIGSFTRNLISYYMFPFVSHLCLCSNPQGNLFLWWAAFSSASSFLFFVYTLASIAATIFLPKSLSASLSLRVTAVSKSFFEMASSMRFSSPVFAFPSPQWLTKWSFTVKNGFSSSQALLPVEFFVHSLDEHGFRFECLRLGDSEAVILTRSSMPSDLSLVCFLILTLFDLPAYLENFSDNWRRLFSSSETLSEYIFELVSNVLSSAVSPAGMSFLSFNWLDLHVVRSSPSDESSDNG